MTMICPYCRRDNADQVLVCSACSRDIAIPEALAAERLDLIDKRDKAKADLSRLTQEILELRAKRRGQRA